MFNINIEKSYGTITSPKAKSKMIIGNGELIIYTEKKYNKFQKKMWKLFFNIEIENIRESEEE